MKYQQLGSAYGRSEYLFTYHDDSPENPPAGYSAAAVLLSPQWKPEDLLWMLNALYGGLSDWTEFAASRGSRSFSFFGERAEDASNLCDALAYAWAQGLDAEYESVLASSHDEDTLQAFVENLFSGEILAGERYADNLESIILAVDAPEQAQQISNIVADAVSRHQFD